MENDEELKERYLRHIMLSDVGIEGQWILSQSKILIIGIGGLGSPACLYLAAAGIGTIGILDYDIVELSNLQRQIIHHTPDLGKLKVKSARTKMEMLNPNIEVITYSEKFHSGNALNIISQYDFIIDATDNFAGKFLINDACTIAKKPFSHAGILKYGGQTMTILPTKTACFSCIFSEPPPSELNSIFRAGLFGVVPGIIGCIQASEAIKFILNIGELLLDNLLTLDIKTMNFRKVKVKKDEHCRVCGINGVTSLSNYPT